ncbi:MAG: RNA polymerase sigma-70 factor [Tannerellaceae bacterium]|nr:RNA polymerase sigma-70 factor [Tannerellaceae bacterium]
METFTAREFEIHFKTLYKPLCLFALRFTGRLEDAEDIVQQAFADVWSRQDTKVAITDFKSYLYRMVRNRSLNFLSGDKREELTEEFPDFADLAEEEQIRCAERDARLWDQIEKLPPERKKIFLMSKRDGMKYKEIAEELGLSVKTVENQISKALKSLRETAIKIYTFFFGVP